MIPKIIHYCWFGGAPLPRLACKCIDSWKKFFPNYEIREWNEENFDVDRLPFTREAYAAKKYAYVSDVARFYILYHEGGIYFDTDVEIAASFDDILTHGAFMGMQSKRRSKVVRNKTQKRCNFMDCYLMVAGSVYVRLRSCQWSICAPIMT